jgi:hypothetical protein
MHIIMRQASPFRPSETKQCPHPACVFPLSNPSFYSFFFFPLSSSFDLPFFSAYMLWGVLTPVLSSQRTASATRQTDKCKPTKMGGRMNAMDKNRSSGPVRPSNAHTLRVSSRFPTPHFTLSPVLSSQRTASATRQTDKCKPTKMGGRMRKREGKKKSRSGTMQWTRTAVQAQ